MKTSSKQLFLSLSAGAILAAVSVSAMAQSQEYRRGYEQGFRDGQAQAQGGPRGGGYHDGGPRQPRIEIEKADYGIRDAYCDARPAVRQATARGSNFSVTASNNLCGDPAPRSRKRLTVVYRCGDSNVMRAQADEGDALTLNCQ
ncbi:MAG: hypothetical protein ACJ8HI_22095 [Massilia sp.]